MMESSKKNDKGFTLIEILIVLAIVSVLVFFASKTMTNLYQSSKNQTDMTNLHSAIQTVRFDIMRKFEMRVKNGYFPKFSTGISTIAIDGFTPVFSEAAERSVPTQVQTFGNKIQIVRATLNGYEQTTYETSCRTIPAPLAQTLNQMAISSIQTIVANAALRNRVSLWAASDTDIADALACEAGMRPVLRVTTEDYTGPTVKSTKSYEIPQAGANNGIVAAGFYFGLAAHREYFLGLHIYAIANRQLVTRSVEVNLPMVDENPYSGNNMQGDLLFFK